MAETLRPWFEGARLHPDVESGKLSMATFAIDFGGVLVNAEGIPLVYRDTQAFWRATHLTSGVKRLLQETLDRLTGTGGDRVLQLRSPFGGGKSHVLLALYHAAKDRASLEKMVTESKKLPKTGKVRVAGIDGEKFDPTVGTEVNGIRVHTLWGALAAHLGCSDLMKEQEVRRTAPGGEVVKKMLGNEPTLILLDEVLRYVERGMGIAVGESNLGRQALEFLETLTTEVANSTKAVLVYSLQASGREAFENIGLLNALDHLAARVDAKREPVIGDEILDVLKKRLLSEPPNPDFGRKAGASIAHEIARWKAAEAPDEGTKRAAQDEEVKKAARLESGFPFHAALIDLMKERWASLPDFQRTRGALRFLAAVLHKSKQLGRQSYVVGPGDIPLDDADVRNAFFTEVGQREQFQAVLEHDLTGPNARAKRLDQQFAQQDATLALVRPATRLATAVLMYSFGGIQRQEGTESIPAGVSEKELLEATLGPDLDNITAQSVLKRLRDECLFLHFDGVRYCFKTTPNVNKIVEDESENVRVDDIRSFVRTELESRIGSVTKAAVVWPQDSSEIPDKEARFILAYLPLEFAEKTEKEKNEKGLEFLTKHGNQLRLFRNGLGLAIPEKKQLEGLRRAAKYILAVEKVKQKKSVYRLTREQTDQLKEREGTERNGFESSMRSLYNEAWLLKMQEGQAGIDRVPIGGRPMKEQGVHERLRELLTDVYQKLFATLKPTKVVDLMRIGKSAGQVRGVDTRSLRDAFYQTLDFTRLTDEGVISRAIAEGAQNGVFGYALKSRVKEEDGKYSVTKDDAILRRSVAPDEIDLDSGFILLPECVIETPEEGAGTGVSVPTPATGGRPPAGPTTTEPSPPQPPMALVKRISIQMAVNRQSLYKAFNALGNLAEKAGEIRLRVDAQKPEGIDRNWLRNAVKEPLEEGGLAPEITEE
jgi:predicted AAA+ superfamily ATPase